jgi:hypothetical protein
VKPVRVAAAVAIGASMAAPAAAQLAPGRSGSSTMQYVGGEEVWRDVEAFGACYAGTERKDALKLIATEPGSRAEAETYRELFRKPYQSCLGDIVELRAPHTMIRGAIAEGLYRKGIPLPPELALPAPQPAQVRNLAGAARCYVAMHPDEARRLLETGPGSRKEHDAVVSLMPEFGKCVPEQAKFGFAATLIRYRIAEALYRTGAATRAAAEKK